MARLVPVLFLALALVPLPGCGEDGEDVPGTRGASVARGGALYDKYWKASDAEQPTETHPLWDQRPDTTSNERTGADTWRCKECHGWDYRGVDGAYAKGSHRTGFPGIVGSTASEADLVTSIAETHGYRAAGLDDDALRSLAMFVRKGLVDTTRWIDENGRFRGDVERGKALYLAGLGKNKACRLCHGEDGLKAPTGSAPDYEDFVGTVANKNPSEFLHKVRFGHPGSKMPAAVRAGVAMQQIVDLAAYAQTLPTKK